MPLQYAQRTGNWDALSDHQLMTPTEDEVAFDPTNFGDA